MKPPSPDALSDLCAAWQARLGLGDWSIVVAYRRAFDLGHFDGRCSPVPERRCAVIGILHPDDYDPTRPWAQDVEHTLVHELLHCYHHAADSGSRAELLEEQGVEAAARALVDLRRAADARRRR